MSFLKHITLKGARRLLSKARALAEKVARILKGADDSLPPAK